MADHPTQGPISGPHAAPGVYSLLYLLCGLLWVLGGDVLLSGYAAPQWQSIIGSVKGALYVAVTTLLLFLVLRRPSVAPGASKGRGSRPVSLWLVFLLLVGGIAGANYLSYRAAIADARGRLAETLGAVSDLVARDIVHWRRDTLDDTRTVAGDPLLGNQLRRWLPGRSPAIAQNIVLSLDNLRRNHGMRSVALFAPDGRTLMVAGGRDAPDRARRGWPRRPRVPGPC